MSGCKWTDKANLKTGTAFSVPFKIETINFKDWPKQIFKNDFSAKQTTATQKFQGVVHLYLFIWTVLCVH